MLLVYLFWVLEWIPNLKAKLKQRLQSMINLIGASQIPFERSMNFQLFSNISNEFQIFKFPGDQMKPIWGPNPAYLQLVSK